MQCQVYSDVEHEASGDSVMVQFDVIADKRFGTSDSQMDVMILAWATLVYTLHLVLILLS